jgi:hypothetical protein
VPVFEGEFCSRRPIRLIVEHIFVAKLLLLNYVQSRVNLRDSEMFAFLRAILRLAGFNLTFIASALADGT